MKLSTCRAVSLSRMAPETYTDFDYMSSSSLYSSASNAIGDISLTPHDAHVSLGGDDTLLDSIVDSIRVQPPVQFRDEAEY